MAAQERLYLLDGMALAYRAYYSFIAHPLLNSRGENTSAIFGFVTALMKILDERPDHIAVVFDTREPTFRHELYPAYKATRQKMPEDMAAQLDKLKEVVRAFNTPLLEKPGYEADDIMGTLARRAERENVLTYLVTGDKDFMQLISPLIKMYRPGKGGSEMDIVEEKGVFEKFGVTPDHVIDVLALMGDQSDNVPGVPGIGEKTAIPLIQKYTSLENLYCHIDEIPRKGVREKLSTHRELAFLSKRLVTIETAVPVEIDFHSLRARPADVRQLLALFTDLDFKSLATRLRLGKSDAGIAKAAEQENRDAAQPDDRDAAEQENRDAAQPDDRDAAQPDNRDAAQPDNRDAAQPDDGDIALPDDRDAAQPDDGDIALPDDRDAAQPDDGDTALPDNRDAAQPDDGDAAQPDDRDAARPEATENITTDNHAYYCVNTLEALEAMCARLAAADTITIDTETTSTDALRATLVGCSFAVQPGEAWYVPVQVPELNDQTGLFADGNAHGGISNTAGALPLTTVIDHLRPILEDPARRKVGQNIKYDMLVLHRHGLQVRGVAFDTMVAGYILRADTSHGLDAMVLEGFRYRMVSYDDLTGTGKSRKLITEVPMERLADYAAEDADWTLRLHHLQEPRLRQAGLLDLCTTMEFPLIEVLAGMEKAGIRLDTAYLAGMSKDIERQLLHLVAEIHQAAGTPFNINSTRQLGEILFKRLGLPPAKKTKTGFSTDVTVLETLSGQHPIIDSLLEYRQLTKLKSTYVDALPALINPDTGRVHTSFNQTVTSTGRLSSSDPNFQNIPIRSDIGRAIRKAFLPGRDGMLILAADYSQIELRVMAHMSGDAGLTEAFVRDEDIHATTAAKVFGVEAEAVTRDMRRKAKEVNFGIMYGIGPFGLASRLGITQGEARDIINRYFERFPGVKSYINDTLERARKTGYVETLLGRRRYIPEIASRNQNVRGNAGRQAINMPIQGTAADMIKRAMIAVHRELAARRLGARLLLQVHDELVLEVPEGEQEEVKQIVVERMRDALPLNVPVKVDAGTGANWLEAH
jgi:DNA polymerase-1